MDLSAELGVAAIDGARAIWSTRILFWKANSTLMASAAVKLSSGAGPAAAPPQDQERAGEGSGGCGGLAPGSRRRRSDLAGRPPRPRAGLRWLDESTQVG